MKDYAEVSSADAEKFAKENDLTFFECAAVNRVLNVCVFVCCFSRTHSHSSVLLCSVCSVVWCAQATAKDVDAPFGDIAAKFHASYEEAAKAVAAL